MSQQPALQGVQRFGLLVINRDTRDVALDGQVLSLTKGEYTLLTTLTEQPRRAFSSQYLMRVLSGSEWVGDTHALQTHISRLRAKLGEAGGRPRQIVTVHGYGYRFVPEPTPALSLTVAKDVKTSQQPNGDSAAYVLLTVERKILWASPGIRRLLGWQLCEIEGTILYDLMHPDDQPAALVARAELTSGLATALMVRMRTTNGDYRNVEVLARPVIGEDASVMLFLSELRLAPPDWTSPTAVPAPIRLTTRA
jgi:PAS domain S-box-containing protein